MGITPLFAYPPQQALNALYKYTHEIFHLNEENQSLEKRSDLFSDREKEIIRYLGMGHTSRQIAGLLNISNDTVRTHRKNILAKAGINNTASLIKYALMNGIY
jgi:DNA-binding CsgD family transcriptional regulator